MTAYATHGPALRKVYLAFISGEKFTRGAPL